MWRPPESTGTLSCASFAASMRSCLWWRNAVFDGCLWWQFGYGCRWSSDGCLERASLWYWSCYFGALPSRRMTEGLQRDSAGMIELCFDLFMLLHWLESLLALLIQANRSQSPTSATEMNTTQSFFLLLFSPTFVACHLRNDQIHPSASDIRWRR